MTNILAIHSVGESLRAYLDTSFPDDIRATHPCEFKLLASGDLVGETELDATLSLFLYRITVNEHARNVRRVNDPARENLPLALEAGTQTVADPRRLEYLDRDLLAEAAAFTIGDEHGAHAAAADRSRNAVRAERAADPCLVVDMARDRLRETRRIEPSRNDVVRIFFRVEKTLERRAQHRVVGREPIEELGALRFGRVEQRLEHRLQRDPLPGEIGVHVHAMTTRYVRVHAARALARCAGRRTMCERSGAFIGLASSGVLPIVSESRRRGVQARCRRRKNAPRGGCVR